MAIDPILIYIKASSVGKVLIDLPNDWPGWRELDIQNDKMKRMIGNILKKYENHEKMEKDSFRKSYREDLVKLGQQDKKVQGLFNKLMEEHAVRNGQRTRRDFRKNIQKYAATFDKLLYDAKQGYVKQLSGLVSEPVKD
jgi:hypothetical protein